VFSARGFKSLGGGQRGFTLIELLVVLVVIGVVIASIHLNLFSDNARRLHTEGERLAALLTALEDESVTSGRPLAVSFSPDGYTFWERTEAKDAVPPNDWQQRPGDEMFTSRHLEADIRIVEVSIRKRPLSLSTEKPERVIFSPSGIQPPFVVLLALDDLRVNVSADAIGNLSVADDFGDER
jgi:general secretion pathway protein H